METPPSKNRKRIIALALSGVLWAAAGPDAADYLFTWRASSDPDTAAYGIFQRTGASGYEPIDEVAVADLADPSAPFYLVSGLADGNTYHFAASAIADTGAEGGLYGKTCIMVDGAIVACDDDDDGADVTAVVSCFIGAAGFGN